MESLKPSNDRILVELGDKYQNIAITEAKYDTKTSGVCVAVADINEWGHLLNNRVYWQEYKEGSEILQGDKRYCFIKTEDIDGYAQTIEKD